MNIQPSSERLWTKNYILLLSSAVFMYLMIFMFTPTLPLFAREFGSGDQSVGGFIVFFFTLGALLPRIPWGYLADRRGRKMVYLIGAAIILAVPPLYGVFTSVAGIFALRFTQGLGFSAASTSAGTMAVDLTPPSRRSEGIGIYTLANTVGMALGPGLGLFFLNRFGSWALFAAGVVSGAICLGIGSFLNYEKKHSPSPAPKRAEVFEKSVLPTCLVLFFTILPYGGIMGYIASFGSDLGIGEIGLYFTVYAVSLFAVRLFVGRLSDRLGVTVILIPGVALMVAGMVVLNWATSLTVFLASALLFGLGYAAVLPLLQSTAFSFCPAERRGAASATLYSTMDISFGLGAVASGLFIQYFGYPIAFACLGAFPLIGLVLFLAILYPLK